jgi:RNA polymerase sigma-70 factor (ECF subfamily)
VPPPPDQDITRILADLRFGVSGAADRLLPIIYKELHGIADRLFASRRPGETIQPTILVHDVFMKLAQKTDTEWESRAHFLAVAAKAMRDLLVDQARRRRAEKRGGDWNRITLSGLGDNESDGGLIDVLDLEDALKRLGEEDPRQERIVELRFYAGLSVEEVARVLNVSERTVMYDWRMARAWLRARLEDKDA